MNTPAPLRAGADLAEPVNAMDHVQGSASAPVTLVEYGDFECPLCGQAYPAVELIRQRFSERLRFVYRHFPLKAHPNAHKAAEAAEAAHAQGQFWEMHELLYRNQLHLEPENLRHYVEQLKLDLRRFEAELHNGHHSPRVQADIASGLRSHIKGTPTFFVNGAVVDTSFGLEQLMRAVERAAE